MRTQVCRPQSLSPPGWWPSTRRCHVSQEPSWKRVPGRRPPHPPPLPPGEGFTPVLFIQSLHRLLLPSGAPGNVCKMEPHPASLLWLQRHHLPQEPDPQTGAPPPTSAPGIHPPRLHCECLSPDCPLGLGSVRAAPAPCSAHRPANAP